MSKEALTLEELKNMQGQPVWCPDLNSYGIIKCDTSGEWKGIPYIHGSQYFPEFGTSTDFEYNILERGLVCQHILWTVEKLETRRKEEAVWEMCGQSMLLFLQHNCKLFVI